MRSLLPSPGRKVLRVAAGSPAGAVLALLLVGLTGCRPAGPTGYQGYLEAEFVHVGAPLAGRLVRLAVTRGQEVRAGDELFELERAAEAAAVAESEHRVAQARARLDNLRKGSRPSELAALRARLARAEANLKWAEADLVRRRQLARDTVLSAADLDLAQSQRDAEAAQVASLKAELETAELGAREDEIRAGEADLAAAAAALDRARWAFDNKVQSAPVAARVHDTLFREGEFVAAGVPVVSLLPPDNLKARFFVPQGEVAALKIGGSVALRADGLAAPVPATITYISTRAEYTPPVIYSRENRAKLVFMVEAQVPAAEAKTLRPGQPVDVQVMP
ncbi:MAG: HlyD family efflux transporter periplasmic adaptor subunit [Verrucomicrobia bacterium]|nr:HlyD family efflux transporter periplasmic adaptor subunit [Verrucomicrobiota bacterium]